MTEVLLKLQLVRRENVSEGEVVDTEFQRKGHLNSLVMLLAHGNYISWIGMKARRLGKLKLEMQIEK